MSKAPFIEKATGFIRAHHVVQGLLMLLGLTVAFWLALALVYCIPQSAFHREKDIANADVITSEGVYPTSYSRGTSIDNFTVAIMLNTASTSGDNPLLDALKGSRYEIGGGMPVEGLQAWMDNDDPDLEPNVSYDRYWNGYLVYLKPLLLFFDIYQIRFIFQTAFLLLLSGASLALAYRRGKRGLAAALLLVFSYLAFDAADTAAVLPMFSSFAISAIGAIWATRVKRSRWNIARGFLLLGAFTVYFDFLDNPVLTLGVPLCVIAFRFCEKGETGWLMRMILVSIGCWFVGYGFIWFMKWVLVAIFVSPDAIASTLHHAFYRAGGGDQSDITQYPIVLAALGANILHAGTIVLLVALFLLCAVLLVLYLISRKRVDSSERKGHLNGILPFVLVGLLPYAWYVVVSNHSLAHSFFTYRDQIVSVLAMLLCALYLYGLFRQNRQLRP